MTKLSRESLLHCLLPGALTFGVNAWRPRGDEAAIGEPFLREHNFASAGETAISAALGGEIAETTKVLPVGEWQGPATSIYGKHPVFVSVGETPPAIPVCPREAISLSPQFPTS